MSDEIKDLDIIFPDDTIRLKFSGKKDKKRYEVTGFIPHALSLFMASPQEGFSPSDRNFKCVAMFLQAQYPDIDVEWVKENLSVQKMNAILGLILGEVGKSNDFLAGEGTSQIILEGARKIVMEMMEKRNESKNPEELS